MNTHCERFNRTRQEEYINYHFDELLETHEFNKGMADYLLWYNRERPHWALNLQSPLQLLAHKHLQECNMWRPDTEGCIY